MSAFEYLLARCNRGTHHAYRKRGRWTVCACGQWKTWMKQL